MPTLASLPKGYEFPSAGFDLTPEWVGDFVAAVEDGAIAGLGDGIVPPMAIAALSIRALLEHAGLPEGAIHAAQEIEFQRPVRVGERLQAAAQVVSRRESQGWVLMAIDLRVETSDGRMAAAGRATITFPVNGATA